jgi:hypothetical protein
MVRWVHTNGQSFTFSAEVVIRAGGVSAVVAFSGYTVAASVTIGLVHVSWEEAAMCRQVVSLFVYPDEGMVRMLLGNTG